MTPKTFLRKPLTVTALVALAVVSCMKMNPGGTSKIPSSALVIREDPAVGKARAKEIREKTSIKLADGLKLDLWASDSLAPDPAAISVDDLEGYISIARIAKKIQNLTFVAIETG